MECGMPHSQFQETVWQRLCYIGNFNRLCEMRHFTQSVSEDCVAGDVSHRQFQETVWQATFHTGSFRRLCSRGSVTQAVSEDCVFFG